MASCLPRYGPQRGAVEGAGKVIQARSMPPGGVCPSPLRDELKRPTESNTRGREGECIDEPVNGLNNSDVTAQLPLSTTAVAGVGLRQWIWPDCSKNS